MQNLAKEIDEIKKKKSIFEKIGFTK